jgi:hypothetical protein
METPIFSLVVSVDIAISALLQQRVSRAVIVVVLNRLIYLVKTTIDIVIL